MRDKTSNFKLLYYLPQTDSESEPQFSTSPLVTMRILVQSHDRKRARSTEFHHEATSTTEDRRPVGSQQLWASSPQSHTSFCSRKLSRPLLPTSLHVMSSQKTEEALAAEALLEMMQGGPRQAAVGSDTTATTLVAPKSGGRKRKPRTKEAAPPKKRAKKTVSKKPPKSARKKTIYPVEPEVVQICQPESSQVNQYVPTTVPKPMFQRRSKLTLSSSAPTATSPRSLPARITSTPPAWWTWPLPDASTRSWRVELFPGRPTVEPFPSWNRGA